MTALISGVSRLKDRLCIAAPDESPVTQRRWELSRTHKNQKDHLIIILRSVGPTEGGGFAKDNSGTARWARMLRAVPMIAHIPLFGKTAPLETVLSEDELIITMPMNLADLVNRVRAKKSKTAEPAPPKPRLRDLINAVNEQKAEMGDELVLSVNSFGRLEAMVKYGG